MSIPDKDDSPLVLNATLRDQFAGQCIQGELAKWGISEFIKDDKQLVRRILWAFKIADLMMLARDGKLKEPKS